MTWLGLGKTSGIQVLCVIGGEGLCECVLSKNDTCGSMWIMYKRGIWQNEGLL